MVFGCGVRNSAEEQPNGSSFLYVRDVMRTSLKVFVFLGIIGSNYSCRQVLRARGLEVY